MTLKFKLSKNKIGTVSIPKVGEILEGRIIIQDKNIIYIDLGPKGIGVIYGMEFTKFQDFLKNLNQDEPIIVKILSLENDEGYRELTPVTPSKETLWEELEKIKKEEKSIEAKIIKIKRGGLLVEIKGSLLAFLPFSLISPEHYSTAEKKDLTKIMEVLQGLIGKILKVQIIELDIKNKRIILSEKSISHKENLSIS